MKRRIFIVVVVILAIPLLGVGGLAIYLLASAHEPAAIEPVTIEAGEADPRPLVAGQPFTVVSWNLQFGAGKTEPFFYEHGTRVRATRDEMDAALPALAAATAEMAPDVLLLQELDRESARTLDIDQFPQHMRAGRFAAGASAAYHRAFVPKPFTDPLGRVDMHLAVMSRGPIAKAERIQLALLKENPVVQAANLKRALLWAELPVEGHDHPLAVAVTHLSAFSRGDGTLQAQIAALVQWIEDRPAGQPWVLAGDFNLLPPGFDKSALSPEAAELYADETNPIDAMIPRFATVIADHLAPENATYYAVGSTVGDRKIDYMFVGGPIEVLEGEVVARYHPLSDHVPIRARLRIGPPPAPEEPNEPPPEDPGEPPTP